MTQLRLHSAMHKFQVFVNAMSTVPRFRVSCDNVRSRPLVACVLERHDLRQLPVFPNFIFLTILPEPFIL